MCHSEIKNNQDETQPVYLDDNCQKYRIVLHNFKPTKFYTL